MSSIISGITSALSLPSQSNAASAQPTSGTQQTQSLGDSASSSQGASGSDGASTGADQASAGASGVAQAAAPPSPAKIVISSILRSAVTGATLMFSLKKFAPGLIGKVGEDGLFTAGVLGKVLKFIPFIKADAMLASGGSALLMTLGVGAAMGAIFGLVTGVIKAKKAVAAYNQQMEQAQGTSTDPTSAAGASSTGSATGSTDSSTSSGTTSGTGSDPGTATTSADGTTVAPAGQPVPGQTGSTATAQSTDPTSVAAQQQAAAVAAAPAPVALTGPAPKPKKNPEMTATAAAKRARAHQLAKTPGARHPAGANYHIVHGDTLWAISRRYHTSIAAIVAANPGIIKDPNLIYAGDWIDVPNAS